MKVHRTLYNFITRSMSKHCKNVLISLRRVQGFQNRDKRQHKSQQIVSNIVERIHCYHGDQGVWFEQVSGLNRSNLEWPIVSLSYVTS